MIEEVGRLKSIRKKENSIKLSIDANKILQDIQLGDSIAVNGICLTTTSFTDREFTADVMAETLSRTSLSILKGNSEVNLERAMPMNGRFGGHIVTGHIDGTGTIVKVEKDKTAIWYTIKTTKGIMKYIVEKGSIAIDGISLTVAKVAGEEFSVSIVPHTLEHTTLLSKKANDIVNLENDCIGKYVEKLLNSENKQKSGLTMDFLSQHGF